MSWPILSLGDFSRLVTIGITPESLHLDFKVALDRGRPESQAELGRDVSQFANTLGGCLLLGIEERRDPVTNIKIAATIRGVADPDRDRADIEQWISNVLVPPDLSRTIDFIRTPQGVLVAVNVPASRRVIWVADPGQRNRLEVVRRTSHGKEYMRPAEIERQWSNTLRSAQIAFHDALAKLASMRLTAQAIEVEIVGGISRISQQLQGRVMQPTSGAPSLGAHDEGGFELRVPLGKQIPTLRVPFELLSTAWVDNNRLNIMCTALIIYDAQLGQLRFDPFNQLRY